MKKTLFIFAALCCTLNFCACSSDADDLSFIEIHDKMLDYCKTYFPSVVLLEELEGRYSYDCSTTVSDKNEADKIIQELTKKITQLKNQKPITYEINEEISNVSWPEGDIITLHIKYKDNVLHVAADIVKMEFADRMW